MTIGKDDRSRGTFEEAVSWADEHIGCPGNLLSIHHVIDNGDGTFSLMSHINCEHCDFCQEYEENKDLLVNIGQKSTVSGPHKLKENSYGNQERE